MLIPIYIKALSRKLMYINFILEMFIKYYYIYFERFFITFNWFYEFDLENEFFWNYDNNVISVKKPVKTVNFSWLMLILCKLRAFTTLICQWIEHLMMWHEVCGWCDVIVLQIIIVYIFILYLLPWWFSTNLFSLEQLIGKNK